MHFGGLNAEKATAFAHGAAVSQISFVYTIKSLSPVLFAFSRFIVTRDDIAIGE